MDSSPWNQPPGSVGRDDEYADTGRFDAPYGDYDAPANGANGYATDHYRDDGAWPDTATTRYEPRNFEPQNYDDLRNAVPSLTPEDDHAGGDPRDDHGGDPRDGRGDGRPGDRPPPRRGSTVRRGGEPADEGGPAQPKSRAGRNLPAAIGVGVVLAGAVVASLLIVKAAFIGVIVIAAGVACRELAMALRTNGTRVPLLPLLVGAVGLQVAAYNGGAQAAGVAMALFVLVVLVWRMAEGAENFLRDATAGVFVALYVPFLASFAALMTAEPNGERRVILFLLVTACSDTGGYATGVLSGGKHPMAPTISPKKSWEGLAGSVITAAAGGAIGMHLLLHGQFWQGAVVGVCAVVSATLGDLAESMIKRDLGIKDMGNLLPGHGGLMDRMDSLLATAPVVWLLLAAFLGS